MSKPPMIIIGAGPSGLMAAQLLAEQGHRVHIYEQQKAAARKFLVAGHGGFNLTHSESIELFIQRYDKSQLHDIIRNFDNQDTIKWLENLGIETYIGSSGKIFPVKGIKPIQVLRAWLAKLTSLGVLIKYEHQLVDFDQHTVSILHNQEIQQHTFTKLIIALGGGSWAKTGSDAKWCNLFREKGITITPLTPANSGYNTTVNFSDLEGLNLKNIVVKFNTISKKGEMVFTNYGIEGSAIYYLNRFTRATAFPFSVYIDLKPDTEIQQIQDTLQRTSNISKVLKEKIKLNVAGLGLLKKLPKEVYTDPITLSKVIKNYPIEVYSFRPIDEVISTAGGISFDEVSTSLSLKKYPDIYCLGEMLDWEAPTGGYLLQACFSMGAWVAKDILAHKI